MQENETSDTFTKGMGIASLVFGILSIVFFFFIYIQIIFALLAIVFGFISIKRNPKGLGKAGFIIGIASLSITIVLFIILKLLEANLFTIPSWYMG